MSEDTDVMFRIGVMDHPESRTALQQLAKGVEDAQGRMTAGVESIGQTASRVAGIVESLTSKIDELQSKQSSAMRGVVPDSVQPMGPPRSSSSGSATPQFDGAEEAAAAASNRIQSRFNGIDLSDMSKSMQNVFASLGEQANSAADEIIEAMERSIAGLAQSPAAQAEVVKQQYQSMMVESSAAYAEMTADLDGYLAEHGSTTEQIGANLRRGEANLQKYRDAASSSAQESSKMFVESALHVAQMAKGLATIGLVSEENAQKFMQSLAVIQGTFDILKGGIEAYEKFGKGMRLARDAQQALTKAQSVASAVETAQLAQVRAYHAALVQETVAANAAAGANGRLAASRAAAGASGAAAAAGSAASGAGSAIGAGGGLLRGLGGLAGGAGAATAAAGAAAAGGVYLAGRAVVESATGSATRSDSSIAGLEARMAAWTLRLTGLFESTDAPMVKFAQSLSGYADKILSYIPGGEMLNNLNVLGDIAGLAASQGAVERGEESLARNRIINEGNREKESARREVEQEKARMRFGSMVDSTRARAEAETQRFGFRDLAGDREAERTNMFNRHKMRSVRDEGALGAATVMELSGNAARMRARPSEAGTQLNAEISMFPQAVAEYAKAKSELDETLSFAGSSDKDREDAMKNATYYHDRMLDSLSRQAQLARASGAERLQIEREIQSAALSAIDQQQAKLDALNDRRKSAMRSFVDMDAVERDMATKALTKARTGGAASLSKMETDLLGRIGTSETEQFVEQSTAAKAKQLGFDAFDQSVQMERRQIEGTRQQLEAQLQASFDVSMKVEADTDAIVAAIMPQTETAVANMLKALEAGFDQKLNQRLGEIQTQITQKNLQLKRQ